MSAPPAALTVASLPTELLECVLGFIPLRPRLRVASLVSKRWRGAALRSVHALSILPPGIALLDKFVALFPNLTAVDLQPQRDDSTCAVTLPARVTRLSVSLRIGDCVTVNGSLTHLRVSNAALCAPLLRASADTITNLNLEFAARDSISAHSELGMLLASVHMPKLRALQLQLAHDEDQPSPLAAFLKAHSAQLTSLVWMHFTEADGVFRDVHFPALRMLAVSCSSATVVRLIQEATQLSHLYLHHNKLLDHLPADRFSSVRILSLKDVNTELDKAANLPNLDSLLLPMFCAISSLPQALRGKVTGYIDNGANISQCSAVRDLSLFNCVVTQPLPHLTFPALEMLQWMEGDVSQPLLPHLVSVAPKLRHLDFRFMRLSSENFAAFLSLLDQAARAGVATVALKLDTASKEQLAQLRTWAAEHVWLRLSVTSASAPVTPAYTLHDLDPGCFAAWLGRPGE